jgi:E3 ubiquitin-protein ligase RNF14
MEDEREVELECIAAIYPEIQFDSENKFSASIELSVHPTNPVKVVFPASSDGHLITPPVSANSGQEKDHTPTNNAESHNLEYLPPLELRITLPEGYPGEQPAEFELSTTPAWLGRAYLEKLQENGEIMWEESGRSSVVYGYIDFLQQEAENAFGFAEAGKVLEIPQDFKISLLDYDIKAAQAAFAKETFDCGVCLGSVPLLEAVELH